MRFVSAILIIFTAMLFGSCRNDDIIIDNSHPPSPGRGVFIVNEGAFPGAGTVSYYSISKDSVFQSIVGTSAGWITPNDVKVAGKNAYIVVNGNDKIEKLNTGTFQSAGSITLSAGTSPGFMAIADSTKAYVANYSGTVSLIDLLADSVAVTSGNVVAFPGGIAVSSGKVYVSDNGYYPDYNNTVRVLNATTLNVLDTVRVGIAPWMMAAGSSGFVYVVCTGNFPSRGKVYTINTTSDIVVDSLEVGTGPSDIALVDHSLFVLHGDRVMRLNDSPLSVADSSFIALSGGLYFYALNIDGSTGDVYVSKVVGTGGSGEVEIHTSTGALKRQPFPVGVFPGAFGFSQ